MEQNDIVLTAFPTSDYLNLCEPEKTSAIINDTASSDDTGIDCSDIDEIHVEGSSLGTDLPSDVLRSFNSVNNCEVFSANSVKNTKFASTLVHNQIVCDIKTLSSSENFEPESLVPCTFVNENSEYSQTTKSYSEIELKILNNKVIKDMNIEKRSVKHGAASLQTNTNLCETVDTSASIKSNLRVTDTSAKCGRINCTNSKNWKSGVPPFVNLPEVTVPVQPVQSGVSLVAVDKEVKGDLTLDINGNFSEHRQPSGLTRNTSAMQGSISRNGDGYERQPTKSDLSHRKIKHTRNTNDSHCYNLPDGISGLQGTNNDELSCEKKYKLKGTSIAGSGTRKVYYSQNSSAGAKSIPPSEELIKKDRIKDVKPTFNSNKNWRNSKQRSFTVHDSSEEEKEINTMNYKRNPQKEGGDNETISSSSCASNTDTYLDWSACVPDPPEDKNPNSLLSSETVTSSVISASNCANSSFMVDNEVSSFVRDFYAVTDPEQQPEESEFKVVVKKQRKHQPKRLDSCRRFSAASGSSGNDHEFHSQSRSHNDKIMLFSNLPIPHHTQLRKLDSLHCKSTSSMPPSEHSSADNSDLDSVHSLPVGSSASNASCSASLPATSSASATLQASYADITRNMPSTSKPHTCNILRQSPVVNVKITEQNNASFAEMNSVIIHNTNVKQIPSDYPGDNLHDIKPCIDSSEGIIFHPSSDNNKESFYAHSSLENVKKSSFVTGLQFTSKSDEVNREVLINKSKPISQSQVSAENIEFTCTALSQKSQHRVPNNSSHIETCIGSVNSQWLSTTTKNNTEDCNSISHELNRSVLMKHKTSTRERQPAVIIMDNCLPTGNVSGVSFGIDFNELLQLNSSNDSIQTSPTQQLPSEASPSVTSSRAEHYGQSLERTENTSEVKKAVHSRHTPSIQKSVEDQGHIPSPNVIAGLCIRWKDLAVDTRTFNYEQIVSFLYKAWDDAIQENSKDSSGREGRMKYYSDTNP